MPMNSYFNDTQFHSILRILNFSEKKIINGRCYWHFKHFIALFLASKMAIYWNKNYQIGFKVLFLFLSLNLIN